MSSRAMNIINTLYGRELRSSWRSRLQGLPRQMRAKVDARKREKRILALYKERSKVLTRGRIIIAIVICLVAALLATSIVYFNRLTRLEQDIFMEQAKIASLLQRRRNISINLARTVRDYAVHEQAIFHHVSNVRAASQKTSQSREGEGEGSELPVESTLSDAASDESLPGKTPETDAIFNEVLSMLEGSSGGDVPLEKKLSGLVAVAESYPDLKLSDNFRRFMEALVETEKEISDRRMEYSDVVNTYSTQLKTYPGKLFAALYGFEPVPYFAADTEAERFRPVEY